MNHWWTNTGFYVVAFGVATLLFGLLYVTTRRIEEKRMMMHLTPCVGIVWGLLLLVWADVLPGRMAVFAGVAIFLAVFFTYLGIVTYAERAARGISKNSTP